jgi:cleavage and polyadenylation specificity factor subunit 1
VPCCQDGSRFGCPQTVTVDHGRQFESQLFRSLVTLCRIQITRTTPYHPASNGLVERLHRSLKAAIMCHADAEWTEAVPLVLLGIRSAYTEDLSTCAAELVYGEPLRISGEFLDPTIQRDDPLPFLQQLRLRIKELRSTPATRHSTQASFLHRAFARLYTRLPAPGLRPPCSAVMLQTPT